MGHAGATPRGVHRACLEGGPMLEKLMPESDEVFDDFDAPCAATVEGTKLLHELFADVTDVAAKVRASKDAGQRGDDGARTAFNRLHKQFIPPFDRADIHRMLSRIDDVLDLADAAAVRCNYYELTASTPDVTELSRVLVLSAEKVAQV